MKISYGILLCGGRDSGPACVQEHVTAVEELIHVAGQGQHFSTCERRFHDISTGSMGYQCPYAHRLSCQLPQHRAADETTSASEYEFHGSVCDVVLEITPIVTCLAPIPDRRSAYFGRDANGPMVRWGCRRCVGDNRGIPVHPGP